MAAITRFDILSVRIVRKPVDGLYDALGEVHSGLAITLDLPRERNAYRAVRVDVHGWYVRCGRERWRFSDDAATYVLELEEILR